VVIDLDVIIGRDPAALPLGTLVALARQPVQRRPIDTREEVVAALLQMLHHLRVDRRYAVANRVVQLDQGEEAPVAQLAEHEARDDADGGLDLGLIPGTPNARRQHDEAVVIGKILIRPVNARLVARWLRDAGFEIVRHRSLWHSAEEVERVDVRRYLILPSHWMERTTWRRLGSILNTLNLSPTRNKTSSARPAAVKRLRRM
jgi:hypothetical protein